MITSYAALITAQIIDTVIAILGKNEKVQVFKYFIIQLACEGDNETGGRWQNLKMINERHYFLEQRQSTLMNSRGK